MFRFLLIIVIDGHQLISKISNLINQWNKNNINL